MPVVTRTHLFLDIAGSAVMFEERGEVGMEKVLAPYERIVRAALRKPSAEADHLGDQFHLVFSTPSEAVTTAITIANGMQRHNARHPEAILPVKFALEAGQTTRRKKTFMGHAVLVAARLVSRAEPGQVLVGESAASLLGSTKSIELRDLGIWKPKGLRPIRVHEARGPDPGPDGSRRAKRLLVTVFHTDVVQSTATGAARGESGWRDMFERYHAIVREELRRHGGAEIDTAGDGFYASFDTPSSAIDCAVAMRDRLRGELRIEVRTGIHTGECEVIAGKIGGLAVVIGGRIRDRAGAGDVLVSRTVKDLVVGTGFLFAERGAATLKGVPGEWDIYAVDAPAGANRSAA
jgi:class 3 adenylate cyclase